MATFSLPGFIQDFPADSPKDLALKARWNINAESWIQQAMPASPAFFYDPSTTPIPPGTQAVPVQWFAFPGRLMQYFSSSPPVSPPNPYNLSTAQVYSLADTGFYQDSNGQTQSFPQVPATLCPQASWSGSRKPFGPYGPRGWLDEYCEWSVARDASNHIVRVDFACENPEYWYSLWAVDPDRVCALYEQTLNAGAPASRQISVQRSDLQLTDGQGQPVIDPGTVQPAYNPLNKWNSGPISLRTGDASQFTGGVMHLTSTPNTLQTELGLAGAATPQYASGNVDAQQLICCGMYGQQYRNSDPHIGQSVNQVVGGQGNIDGKPRLACLANPVGLYLQTPDLSSLKFGPAIVPGQTVPVDARPTDVFQILRGTQAPIDPVTGQPFPGADGQNGDMLLHIAFQIPASWLAMTPTLTLADLTINQASIAWGGQLAQQMQIALFARPLPTPLVPPTVACAGSGSGGSPLQCMFQVLWDGYYPIQEPSPGGQPMSLASNTVIVPPWLPASGSTQQLMVTVSNPPPTGMGVSVMTADGSQPDPAITTQITATTSVTYAVPGNSYPDTYTAISFTVQVAPGTTPGLRALAITGGGTLPCAVYIRGGA